MSNGTLAELPPENINIPDEPSVMLLLPHNKYLLGTGSGKWIFASTNESTKQQPQNVFLYDDQVLSLLNEGTTPTIIPALTVNALRKELFSLTEPPGRYVSTVLMLRTFMKDHPVFNSDSDEIPDEKIFNEAMNKDFILCRAYWTLRFALARSELETVRRLKAWLKADPKTFSDPQNVMKIWFSILDTPDKEVIKELEELSFTRLEIEHISKQHSSPLVVYNPLSGWLMVGRFGKSSTMFLSWSYLNHNLWHELRERKKMKLHDIIHAVWGEYETQQAIKERAKYKGADN